MHENANTISDGKEQGCGCGERIPAPDLSLIDPILQHYKDMPGNIIPVLQEAQKQYGYLPEAVLVKISKELKVALSHLYGVVTFYSQFYLKPRGRHTIKSCQGTACHVRGSKRVLQAIEDHLEIKDGETTPDMHFSIETVACLGTCFLAPAVMIGHDYYGDLEPKSIKKMLNSYKVKQ